jgi:magnesium-transporting ATPase (P-type)
MVAPAHAGSAEGVASELGVDPATGLTRSEAASRLLEFGANALVLPERPPYLRLAARQLVDPLVLLLVVAATISFLIGDGIEGGASQRSLS